jgi:hypothetical protein
LRDHPITHHVADLDNETAHRDKAGRPRASTRPLRPPSPPTTSSRGHPGRQQPGRRARCGVPGQIRRKGWRRS